MELYSKRLETLRNESGSDYIDKLKQSDGIIDEHFTDSITRSAYEDKLKMEKMQNDIYSYANAQLGITTQSPILPQTDLDDYSKQQVNDKIPTQVELDNSDSEAILNSANLFTKEQIGKGRFNEFARYGILDPYNEHSGSREYIFFSKPDLHIFNTESFELYKPLKNSGFFCNAIKQYPESLLSLQQTFNYSSDITIPNGFNIKNKFIPLLSNQVSSTLDLPAISATETQNNNNLYQIGTSYRDGSEISDCNVTFSLTFKDTKFLDVYMFLKAYDEYRREELLRDIRPVNYSYIDNKISSKEISVWKIIVDETNRIIFYAKIIGAYPLNVPRDTMSNFEGGIMLSAEFKGQWMRDMNPSILLDINRLTETSLGKKPDLSNALNLYNKDLGVPNTKWAKYPYIIKGGNRPGDASDNCFYRLIWV